DNEKAADYLRLNIGQDDKRIEWVVVRPDGLIDESDVSEYDIHPSPTRDALFNAGSISRINVAHFMSTLISDNNLWIKWKGKMPVIYDKTNDFS
ncbi:MAG: 3'-phosphoadenosine 5'-phosphosulfate sulfotransferase, partial [Candidatus Azotimanducaceae bacterium]